MKIAGFYDESISNGEGWRAVLFVSGCPHHCPGCHNKEAQDFGYGEEFDKQEILDRIKENSILKGITLSGGEPLCKENINEVHQCSWDKDKEIITRQIDKVEFESVKRQSAAMLSLTSNKPPFAQW